MKTYTFCFEGRQLGAMGITYYIVDRFVAACLPDAIAMLYSNYEHISMDQVLEDDKEIAMDTYLNTSMSEKEFKSKFDINATFNERLNRAGVETIKDGKIIKLKFGNASIERPRVNDIERIIYQSFHIMI